MKKLLAMIAVGALGTCSFGDILISWQAQAGFYLNGQFGVDPGGALLNPAGATIAMLIWSPDNIINDVDSSNVGGNYTGGNDLFLDQFAVTFPGTATTIYGDYNAGPHTYLNASYGGTILQGGYVYARIFQDGTPAPGEYYFDSTVLLTTAYTGSETPQILDHNSDNTNGNELNKPIAGVPEPSALAFLGVGALVVAFRRMRRA